MTRKFKATVTSISLNDGTGWQDLGTTEGFAERVKLPTPEQWAIAEKVYDLAFNCSLTFSTVTELLVFRFWLACMMWEVQN